MKYIVILFLGFSLVACGDAAQTKVKKEDSTEDKAVTDTTVQVTDDQIINAGIETGMLQLKNISSALKVSGAIDVPPQNIVSVSEPLGGYLKSTRLLPGMAVRKGQAIASMEDPQYIQLQQDYLTAKAKLVYAEQEYNRQKELNQSKASSDKVFQQAQTEYSTVNVLVNSLAEKLRLININPSRLSAANISASISLYAPISGYVSKVNVNIGKYVTPSEVLFEIINPASIHLALNVFEKDVPRLHIGQRILTYSNANPEKKYTCKIILIGHDYSEDRSVEVHAHFEEFDKALIPGTYMNAEVETQNKDVYALPSDAVVTYENEHFVFVEKSKGTFEITQVVAGNTQNGFIEIDSTSVNNLKDKKIAVKGAYSLLMKMKNTSDD
ncbi:MAG TPA: efflux RND transporter periplasmic adaptor subunit [Flavitalea sp.]|nr:efflux RND transporter periplasmic adaptor subunit [Flavitalea sp.]